MRRCSLEYRWGSTKLRTCEHGEECDCPLTEFTYKKLENVDVKLKEVGLIEIKEDKTFYLHKLQDVREILSHPSYGHKGDTTVAVLSDTGKIFVFSRTENNEKPIVIESYHYKQQKKKKMTLKVLMVISIPFFLTIAAYYINFGLSIRSITEIIRPYR